MAHESLSSATERRLKSLGEYQYLVKHPMLPIHFGLILVVFLLTLLYNYVRPGGEDTLTWSMLRTADAELSVAVEAEDWPAWARWITDVESPEETLAWIVAEMQGHDRSGLLTHEGQAELVKLERLLEGEGQWEAAEEIHERLYSEGFYRWDLMTAEAQFGGQEPEWWEDATAYYREVAERQEVWYQVGSYLWLVILVVGIPFLPAAVRCFYPQRHVPPSPVTRAWRPGRTFALVLLADLLAGFGLYFLYRMIPYRCWEDYPAVTTLVSDSIWRIGGPALVLLFICVRWKHLPRLLGLTVRPQLKPVLGMLSLGVIYNYLSFQAVSLVDEPAFLLNLSPDEIGWMGLVYAILSAVILAPVLEEVVYRGVVFQSQLRHLGFFYAMLVSTVLFAAVHYYDWYGMLSVAFFGIAACGLFRRTGSLWTAILYHVCENGFITLGMWPVYFGAYRY